MSAYNPKVTPWAVKAETLPGHNTAGQLAFLLRFAILAPSTHNTQPWKFKVDAAGAAIHLHIDSSRWLRVADADQRELHVSAGTALENVLIAGEHFGFAPQVRYFPQPQDETHFASVKFGSGGTTPAHHLHLFDAIPARHTNHKPYDGRPIDPNAIATLHSYVVEDDVSLFVSSDENIKRNVDALVVQADAQQFADANFRNELSHWIGQGVFGASWLMAKLAEVSTRYLNEGRRRAAHDADVLRGSPALAVLFTQDDSRLSQVQAGQVYERLHLLATYLGISVQPMNQVLQAPALKAKLVNVLPADGRAVQMLFRMGFGEPEAEHTPRRELAEMML